MPPAHAAPVPPQVPGYTLQELLGRGGSGEVWRAEPRGGGTAVAVKVLVAGDPERQAREAALLGELDHPHLVRLHRGGAPAQPRRGAARGARPRPAGRRQPGRAARPARPASAGRGGHGHRPGGRGARPRARPRRRPRRPVPGQHRVHRRRAARAHRPRRRPGARRGSGGPGHAGLRRPHRRAGWSAGPGVRRLRRRGGRLPRPDRRRPVERVPRPVDTLAVAADGQLPDLAELAPEAPAGAAWR